MFCSYKHNGFLVSFLTKQFHFDDIFQERFPDPKSLVKGLNQNGIKAIWMLDPGIKQEDGYFVYDSGCKSDVWISRADGRPFVGTFSLCNGNRNRT